MATHIAHIGLLARLFATNATYREIEVAPYNISLKRSGVSRDIEGLQALECRIEEGLIWASLVVRRLDGDVQTIGGLGKSKARAMKLEIDSHIQATKDLIRQLEVNASGVKSLNGARARH